MLTFLKKTKLLSTICMAAIIVSVLRVLTTNLPEWFDGAEEWFEFIDNLSLAYIASYFFYIVQVYLPEKRREDSLIPLRAALQREVQFFTIWIVQMWKNLYEYAMQNGMLEAKSKDKFLNAEILLAIFDKIILTEECPYIATNISDKSWRSYIEMECLKIIGLGDKIITNRAAELPPDIYYAVFYLASESSTVCLVTRLMSLFHSQKLDMSGFTTLGQMIPKNSQEGIRDIDIDIESVKKLITWVNHEYDFLQKQSKYSLAHIYKVGI